MEFEFAHTEPKVQSAYRTSAETPMRILVMGDFTGRENRGVMEHGDDLVQRPVVFLDVDDLDGVLYRFAPRLHLPLGEPGGPGVAVEFKSMEDFHPDELFRRLDVFGELRNARSRLMDPATFAEAAAELSAVETPPETPPEEAAEEVAPEEDDASTLARLLGREPVEAPSTRVHLAGQQVDVSRLIRDIVAPHIVPETDPRQESFVASVDSATAAQMRALLGHPAFKGLEAAWRGLEWLVTNVETDEMLTIHAIDVTKEELAADLSAAGGDLTRSGLFRLLVESGVRTPGGQPWSVIVGDYTFGPGAGDAGLLAALGSIASQAGGPFLSAASPACLGCSSIAASPEPAGWAPSEDDAARWQALRVSPVAPWLGLALPRVLLRLPYGERTDEIESFTFEEALPGGDHEAFLWGSPALACAILIAATFTEAGWSGQPGSHRDVGDLPAHTYVEDGESKMTPCAEAYLSETAAEAILARGIMPLLSLRNLNAARLLRFQSLADPPKALAGPWG
ncbi:MAG: type VI secretion system contractile sheath domain-containing protein [Planctomycetota bacterium]